MNNLLRYIKGLRRGKDAHRIELEALKDVFLSEALEGYEAIEDNHSRRIANLQEQVKIRSYKNYKAKTTKPVSKEVSIQPKANIPWKKWSVTAVFLLCLSSGAYYLTKNTTPEITDPVELQQDVSNQQDTLIQQDVLIHQDTLIRPDTLLIYMPELPQPKLPKRVLQDSTRDNRREIEILKLDAPQIQVQSPSAPKLPKTEIEISF